jgi:O-antigen ligase
MLLLTAVVCALAGAATWFVVRREQAEPAAEASLRARQAVAVLAALALLIPVIGAPLEFTAGDAPDRGADAGRFRSVGSNRYAYWRVALESVPDRPIKGIGPGGYRVVWMEERPIDEAARDAHSLQLETVAELGLPGFAFLAVLGGAVWAGAAAAIRRGAAPAAGMVAALVAWALSTSVDWMWEMPAVALLGLLLSAALLRQGEATAGSRAAG